MASKSRSRRNTAGRGFVNNTILECLLDGDKYGYEIIKEVKDKTDGKVVFKINGKTVALVNATKGIATYNYVASSLSAKNYTITATYGGNKLYESSRSPASILTVTPIPTKI